MMNNCMTVIVNITIIIILTINTKPTNKILKMRTIRKVVISLNLRHFGPPYLKRTRRLNY